MGAVTGFDFIFALFSLLLGLAVAEIMTGYASLLKLRARARAGIKQDVRIGWLTPLLGGFVLLNQLSMWMSAYAVRDGMPFTYLTLMAVLVVVGGYYLLSTLVFPDDPAVWPDFDAYYDQQKRTVLIGLVGIGVLTAIGTGRFRHAATAAQRAVINSDLGTYAAIGAWVQLVLILWLIFARGRRTNAVLLVLVSLLNMAGAVLVAATGISAG